MTNKSLVPSVFSFHSVNIRAFSDDSGEPWFSAKDVCSILGYRNDSDAVKKHCRDGGVAKRDLPTTSGIQSMTFINEGNLYRLIIKSRKPEAVEFEIKLMEEILPAIRKTGKYEIQSKAKRQSTSLPTPKKYNYPRRLLEQSGFFVKGGRARLNISMLANKNFVSPLMHLLNDLRTDGHDIEAAWDEAIAMRDGILEADEVLMKISIDALEANHKTASSALDR